MGWYYRGVLAFFARGGIELYADIDVSGLGFRGGDVSNNPDGNCGIGSPDFFYPLVQSNTTVWDFGGAKKGEGIAELHDDKIAGKGKLANGGGGGNKHNHGGGGGGNYTAGGQGGESLAGCGIDGNMGTGGLSLTSFISGNTVFMGGGGGCGDFNNNVGSIGEDGGGIILIKAASLSGDGHNISANGNDVLAIGGGIADGMGGGGAGGSVYLDIPSISTQTVIKVDGGHGGDQMATYGCVGPGGGGGTGVVLLTMSSTSSNISVRAYPGRAGVFLTTNFADCAGTSYYATAGDSTRNGVLNNVRKVNISNNPGYTVDLGSDTAICTGEKLILSTGINAAQYLWQDGSTGSTYTVTSAGTYSVSVTKNGCTNSSSIRVDSFSCNCKLELPNAFSPNGDGKNDEFGVVYECTIQAFEINIYNRWGQLVYSSHNILEKWDGRYKGEPQPTGVYTCMISYTPSHSDISKYQTGNISLQR